MKNLNAFISNAESVTLTMKNVRIHLALTGMIVAPVCMVELDVQQSIRV